MPPSYSAAWSAASSHRRFRRRDRVHRKPRPKLKEAVRRPELDPLTRARRAPTLPLTPRRLMPRRNGPSFLDRR